MLNRCWAKKSAIVWKLCRGNKSELSSDMTGNQTDQNFLCPRKKKREKKSLDRLCPGEFCSCAGGMMQDLQELCLNRFTFFFSAVLHLRIPASPGSLALPFCVRPHDWDSSTAPSGQPRCLALRVRSTGMFQRTVFPS